MKKILSSILLFVFILLLIEKPNTTFANDSISADTINHQRLNTILYTGSALYASTMGVLYFAWYKDNDLTNFHWFNDNKAWLQVDKVGHATTAYIISNYAFWSYRWAGVDNNRAAIYAGITGWGAQTVIEILDGFSSEWGASPGDLLANTAGVTLFTGQQLLWKEQRIRLKFSYHTTDFPQYRPDLLGDNNLKSILKDYNGQTYWLSVNIASFIKTDTKIPSWLNVGVGYGATGMLGSFSNPQEWQGNTLPHYDRYRQYYVSMDVDWTRIQTRSSFLKFVFKTLNFVKLPFPTLEYNSKENFIFHWIYF